MNYFTKKQHALSSHGSRFPTTGVFVLFFIGSAGVGRTGTFICVDRLLQKIREPNATLDIFGTVLEMRNYRCKMVQSEVLCYT